MADPRVKFKCAVAGENSQAGAMSYTNLLNKAAGGASFLGAVTGNKNLSAIGSGMKSLVEISNSIRGGCATLPSSYGVNNVLSTLGADTKTMNSISRFNPQAANKAYGEANQILGQMKTGKLSLKNAAGYVQSFQNLAKLAQSIFPKTKVDKTKSVSCLTSPYAIDLVRTRAPKYKFLFIVQFTFTTQYNYLQKHDFAFGVKKSSRPGVKFTQEDVNYYNFRTKVTTKTEFEEIAMSFHDDIGNKAMEFYNEYRRALSPIANMSNLMSPTEDGLNFDETVMVRSGLTHDENRNYNMYTASRGPINGDGMNVIDNIKLYHVYDAGRYANIYTFLNPRITQMDLDDVDMTASQDGSEFSMKFNYDTVYIQTGVDVDYSSFSNDEGIFKTQDVPGIIYPMRTISSTTDLANAQAASAALAKIPDVKDSLITTC